MRSVDFIKKSFERIILLFCVVVDRFFAFIFSLRIIRWPISFFKSQKIAENTRAILIILFLVGMLLRVTLFAVIPSYYPREVIDLSSDSKGYDQSAWNGLNNGDFSTYESPGFPVLLSGFYFLFGHDILIPTFFLIFLGSFLGLISFFISKKIFGSDLAGIISFAYICFHPSFIWASPRLLSDTLALVLFALIILMCLEINESMRNKKNESFKLIYMLSFGVGMLFAYLLLVRAIYTGFGVVLFILFAQTIKDIGIKKMDVGKLILVVVIGFLLIFSPWLHYTNEKLGEPMLFSTNNNGGINFYKGNNPYATGRGEVSYPPLQSTGEVERNHEAFEKGIEYIINNPLNAFVTDLKKVFYFVFIPQKPPWELSENHFSSVEQYLHFSVINSSIFLTLLVGLRGLISMKKEKNEHFNFIIFASLWFFSISIAFYVYDRYLLPFQFLMILGASHYLCNFLDTSRGLEHQK